MWRHQPERSIDLRFATAGLVAIILGVTLATGCGLFSEDEYDVFRDRRVAELARAASRGDIELVNQLVADGVDVNARGQGQVTPLILVLDQGPNKEGFKTRLQRGADPNPVARNGKTVMHMAARNEGSFWLRQALAHGGDPNLINSGHRHSPNSTPIFSAITTARLEAPADYRIDNIPVPEHCQGITLQSMLYPDEPADAANSDNR